MVSEAECCFFAWREEHINYPLKLFGILRGRSVVDEILAEADGKPCMLDDFSAQFIAKHKGAHLHSVECLTELMVLATVMELDIASVEASHAFIRRLAVALSVQTH